MRPLASGRPRRHRTAIALAVAAASLGGVTLPAVADPGSDGPGSTPSKADVDAAQDAVAGQKRTVAAVRTDLLLANQRLEKAAIRAEQAAEAWNAAQWQLQQARADVRSAQRRQAIAERTLAQQQTAYDELVATTYESSPDLAALNAIVEDDGVTELIETATTTYQVSASMDDIEKSYQAALDLADLARDDAADARADAAHAADAADRARGRAETEANAAAAEADRITHRKDRLLAELAELQHISVTLAAQRQAALELAAQRRAAAAAAAEQAAAEAAAQQAAAQAAAQQQHNSGDGNSGDNSGGDNNSGDGGGDSGNGGSGSSDTPAPDPAPPAPSGGASAAIDFARAQLGEPYVWGGDGPDSWDCSGLTMASWRAGGKYLPHYSVGQYADSTPISSGQLQPGDLVFWGSSSSPSSIYHVALYLGGGRIIHAPRTGRPVTEDSMYYWIPPNFFARP